MKKPIPCDAAQECAGVVLGTIPLVMRTIGGEMRKRHSDKFQMQQFRALMFIKVNEGASLSVVSEHLGLTISATSKLIEDLVEKKYVKREVASDDRRRVTLALSKLGIATLESVRAKKLEYMADLLRTISPSECSMIMLAMDLLHKVIIPTHES